MTTVLPGQPFPLGATWDGAGVNFALFSEHAQGVELCLFDEEGRETRVGLTERTGHDWHGYLPGLGPGQRYGYRVHGPWAPEHGHRFNPAKLLLDPYARAIEGDVDYRAANTLPYVPTGESDADLELDDEDDADAIPKCVVVDPAFDWEGDEHPSTPWADTIVYELHVKGFTARHPGVPEHLRGTYAGLASDAAIEHVASLGVTAVELLPVHHFADEHFLHERGLVNYWGYSSIGYFAPSSRYAATGRRGEQVSELKGMVKALHRAGIEVILDVVYNHTAEGSHLGPMLSFRGIDNAAYYRLRHGEPRLYADFAGTGNTLDVTHPAVLRLVLDSLRYWVTDFHVDGFRFDLASVLARGHDEVDLRGVFLSAVHQDPVLSHVKLIAEPWDVGPGGYQVGAFPAPWTEWNDRYRDTMRDHWRGHADVAAFAGRITGSGDLYRAGCRTPSASVNFVTAHDGFTLADLVSYERKHNEANGEESSDGTDNNRSWNCGVEGPTDDAEVVALRARQQRNVLTTLLLSLGTPMLLGGDELGRTQHGNNNAWCQDNEVSWLDWELDEERERLLAFAKRVIEIRRRHPVFRRTRFLEGGTSSHGAPDSWWFRPDGRKMTRRDWHAHGAQVVGLFLNGEGLGRTPEGEPVAGDSFCLLVNPGHEPVSFVLPPRRFAKGWDVELSTADPDALQVSLPARGRLEVEARSLTVLRAGGVR